MFESVTIGGRGRPEVLVVGCFQGEKLDAKTARLDRAGVVAEAIGRAEFTGEAGVVVEAFAGKVKDGHSRVWVVGLGKRDGFSAGSLRAVGAGVGRRLAACKATSADIELGGSLAGARIDQQAAGRGFGEAVGLLAWVCDEFRGSGSKESKRVKLALRSSHEAFSAGMGRGVAVAQSVNFTRTLSQTPPNIATPDWMAQQAQAMAKRAGLACRVMRGAELEREKMTGLINVGKASENKPCMIRLEYRPAGVAARGGGRSKPLVLIGKTMTYDTGGLSLKINNGMVGMKRDKDGGCAVLGAMHAIATVIKPRRPVVALLAAAENSISDEAYRPDDILRYRNDVTVEVTNTDAEGRLVLADALCWACEKENPEAIIDLATLTGGVVIALGSTYCGMFCEDAGLRERIEQASVESGERVWRLPMHEEYREMMKSPVADILNSNPNRKAHPIQGAAFLSYFVKESVPWCHLDIAGVHVAESNKGMFVEGPTGWGVRLLASLLEQK